MNERRRVAVGPWIAALSLVATASGALAADETPPVTRITSRQPPGMAMVAGEKVFGEATDDVSGVASVTVTFTPEVETPGAVETSGSAVLGCKPPTRCTWAIDQPATPGLYAVTAFATDVAGNVESPGDSGPLIDVAPRSAPLGGTLVPDRSQKPIQPGAPLDLHRGPLAGTRYGVCTMNFVFADAASTYVGTAGHCVIMVGERASAPGVGEFGTVVSMKECRFAPCAPGETYTDDFALIRDVDHYCGRRNRAATKAALSLVAGCIGDRIHSSGAQRRVQRRRASVASEGPPALRTQRWGVRWNT